MATLGKAVVELSADTGKFTGDVGRAAVMFDKNMASMAAAASKVGAIVGLAGAAVSTGLAAMVRSSIDNADNLGKLSQKIGLTTERLSELKLAAELGDLSSEGFEKGMREFNRSLVEAQDNGSKAAEVFRALGVDIKAGPDVALRQFAEAMSKLEDGELKTAAAMEVLKKSGADWIPTLNAGARGFDDAAEKARGLGLVIGGQFAKDSEMFNDSLKLIGKTVDALAISIGKNLVGGLSVLTENLAQAAAKGNLLWQSMIEGAKMTAALLSKLPSWTELGKVGQEMAGGLFEWDAQQRAMRSGPSAWPKAGGTAAAADLPGAPDPAALACTLSGGKWVNGKCVRAATGGKAPKDSGDADYARSLQMQQDMLDEAGRLGTEFLMKQQREIDAHNEKMREADIRGWIAHADAVFEEAEKEALALAKIQEEAGKTSDIGRELGLTFSSAFEDAILQGKKFGDVVRAIGQDIARLILRKTVTEPAAAAVSSIVGKIDFGKIFGDMLPSFAVGTDYVPHDMVAQIHQGEKIIPAGENAGSGGVTVVQNISIDSRSDRSSILQAMGAAKDAAKAEIMASLQRGGAFAQATGKV